MLLQDKTSKIEKLQQLLHSERQRMELLIGAVLVPRGMRLPPLFPAGLASAADPWRGARRACQNNQRGGRSRSTTGSSSSCCRRRDGRQLHGLPSPKSYGERVEREIFRKWSTIHNASNIVYQRDRCESCGSGLFN